MQYFCFVCLFVCLFICSKKHLINSNNVQQNWSTQSIKMHSLRLKNCQGTHMSCCIQFSKIFWRGGKVPSLDFTPYPSAPISDFWIRH